MKVAGFELADCPTVRAADARAMRSLLPVVAGLPSRWGVVVPPFGPITITILSVGVAPLPAGAVTFSLSRGPSLGRVAVEPLLAARLVDVALAGRSLFTALRPLGPAERALLAAVLGPAFERIGWTLLATALPEPGAGGAGISLRLGAQSVDGVLRLDLPPGADLDLEVGSDGRRVRAARLPLIGSIEIAVTALRRMAAANLAVGDAVVFEDVGASSYSPHAGWDGWLTIGGRGAPFAWPLAIDSAGHATVTGAPFTIREETEMSTTDFGSKSPIDATTVIGGAPVEVVAELGRLTLRGEELMGLVPGAVLPLRVDRREILLRAGGEPWARGEIVDVDGELGVRVTRLVSR